MNPDAILTWTRDERLSLADFLESLSPSEWQHPTLCPKWTVHELAAHLTTSTRTTLGMMIWGGIKAGGSFDRMEANLARDLARRFSPAELIAQLRETAGSAKRAPGAGPLDPLADALVHGQDLARPLGRVREMPVAPAVAALGHVVGSRFYGARKRFAGMRLVATDAEWSAGEGEELRGPVSELLMVATGRAAGLAGLSGPGVERLGLAFAR